MKGHLHWIYFVLMLKVSFTKVTRRIKLKFQRQKNIEKLAGTLNQTVKSKVVRLIRLAEVVHIVVPLSYWCVDNSKKWIARILQILHIKISNQCLAYTQTASYICWRWGSQLKFEIAKILKTEGKQINIPRRATDLNPINSFLTEVSII